MKAVEQKEKDEKQEAIRDIYVAWGKELCELVPLEKYKTRAGLTKPYTLAAIEDDVKTQFAKVRRAALHRGAPWRRNTATRCAWYTLNLWIWGLPCRKNRSWQSKRKKWSVPPLNGSCRQCGKWPRAALPRHPFPPRHPYPSPRHSPPLRRPRQSRKPYALTFGCGQKVQLQALKEFLRNNQIKYGRVPKEA